MWYNGGPRTLALRPNYHTQHMPNIFGCLKLIFQLALIFPKRKNFFGCSPFLSAALTTGESRVPAQSPYMQFLYGCLNWLFEPGFSHNSKGKCDSWTDLLNVLPIKVKLKKTYFYFRYRSARHLLYVKRIYLIEFASIFFQSSFLSNDWKQ